MAGEGEQVSVDGPRPATVMESTAPESGNTSANGTTESLSDKKRVRSGSQDVEMVDSPVKRQKGVAPIKAE